MKSWLIVLLLILISLTVGCSADSQTAAIPQSAINEIYAADDDEIVNKYIEIKHVEDKGGYCYIQIDIKPEVCEDLEHAFELAGVFTDATAQNAVKIFNRYGINKDISVWARLPLGNNEVALLGRTWYSASSNSYKFERYTEMN